MSSRLKLSFWKSRKSENKENPESEKDKNIESNTLSNFKKYASSNYLWLPSIMFLIFVGLIYYFINNQQSNTKDYVKSIIKEVKKDTTKYKLDSLTNHRLITLEINQNSYSNNISFYSIFISVLIAILIVIIGYSVYFNNKENVLKLEEKQKILDKDLLYVQKLLLESIEKLTNFESKFTQTDNMLTSVNDKNEILNKNISDMNNEQVEFKIFIEENKALINQIVESQKFYHYELFDYLSDSELNKYKYEKDKFNKLISITNSWTYNCIRLQNYPAERKLIYSPKEFEENLLLTLEYEFYNEDIVNNIFDFTTNDKNFILLNLKDSLKFIEENGIKLRVQKIIEKFETYRTKDELNEDIEDENNINAGN